MQQTASDMNYTCVCVAGFVAIEIVWWFIAGRKYSEKMQKATAGEEKVVVRVQDKEG